MCKYIDDSMQTFPRIAHSLAKQRPKRHELAVANHYSVHAFFLWRNHVREKSLSASPSLLSPRKASRHIPSLLARTKGASCSAPSSRVPGHSLCVNMHESYPDVKLWGNAKDCLWSICYFVKEFQMNRLFFIQHITWLCKMKEVMVDDYVRKV